MKHMEKWCTYGAWGRQLPSFIGKLVQQDGNSGKIQYAERQLYPCEFWDMRYVTVFDTLEEAILYFAANNCYDHQSIT